MTWIRDGSFPLVPSGLEINFSLLSKEGRKVWITVKGEDQQTTERVAEAITRLNPTPDLIADIETDPPVDRDQFVAKERSR